MPRQLTRSRQEGRLRGSPSTCGWGPLAVPPRPTGRAGSSCCPSATVLARVGTGQRRFGGAQASSGAVTTSSGAETACVSSPGRSRTAA